MFRLGDKGLVVEYLNYVLGVNSKEFTEETENNLKQFQCSFRQLYVDKEDEITYMYDPASGEVTPNNLSYNPYDEYYKPGDELENFPNTSLYIYPNGILDIYTLPALTGIEIPNFNTNKIKQVQKALSWTVYSNNNPLKLTGEYNQETCDSIRNFQKKYKLFQPFIPIVDQKNLLSNSSSFWSNNQVKDDGSLEESNTVITSNFIALDFNYNYYIKSFTKDYSVRVYFYTGPVDSNIELVYTYVNQATAMVEYKNYTDFSMWYDGQFYSEGLIPFCNCSTTNKATKIRVSLYKNDNEIIPQDIEKIQIQLEKNDKATSYEPNSLNIYNTFYSGFLNIPTYNGIKKEFKLPEVE